MQELKKTNYYLLKMLLCAGFFVVLSLNNIAQANAQSYLQDCTKSPLIISELYANPEGEDLGKEWIEIYNTSTEDININGLNIYVAGTQYKLVNKIESDFFLESNAYALICEMEVEDCDIYTTKLGIQNGGSATDAVRIVKNNSCIQDTLLYDSPNINLLLDDKGQVVEDNETASSIQEGKSLCRQDLEDSDSCKNDFAICDKVTPGEKNSIDYKDYLYISEIIPSENIIELISQKNVSYANWYIEDINSGTKYYLDGNYGYPIFTINIEISAEEKIYNLYSPNQQIVDSVEIKGDMLDASLCRMDNLITDQFQLCKPTINSSNLIYDLPANKLDILNQSNENSTKYLQSCFLSDGDQVIAFDDERSFLLAAENFQNSCFYTSYNGNCINIDSLVLTTNATLEQKAHQLSEFCYSWIGYKKDNRIFINYINRPIINIVDIDKMISDAINDSDKGNQNSGNAIIIRKAFSAIDKNTLLSIEENYTYKTTYTNFNTNSKNDILALQTRFSTDNTGNPIYYAIIIDQKELAMSEKALVNSSFYYKPFDSLKSMFIIQKKRFIHLIKYLEFLIKF